MTQEQPDPRDRKVLQVHARSPWSVPRSPNLKQMKAFSGFERDEALDKESLGGDAAMEHALCENSDSQLMCLSLIPFH